jgi:glucose-6-phosphate isomerase
MLIQLDTRNMLARMVGEENGVADSELKEGARAARAAMESFESAWKRGLYGFPDLPTQKALIDAIAAWAKSKAGSYDTVCVCGIGGSALGAWALDCGLRGPHPVQGIHSTKLPRLVILDNVDPAFISNALASMNPKKTIVASIAKSGATAETASVFLMVREWLEKSMGKKAKDRIVVVTSESRGDLKTLATAQGYTTFHLPENVGGRFSVLSAVGLVPAALIGVNIHKLCKGAAAMTQASWKGDINENVAMKAALYHFLVWTRRKKTIQVAFPYANQLWGTAFWFRQLWAESLGKTKDRADNVVHVGQTPIAALGTTDQHSQVQLYMEGPNDKAFSFWAVEKFSSRGAIPRVKTGLSGFDYLGGQSLEKLIHAERRATEAALTAQGRPNCTFTLQRIDEESMGAFLQMMMFETAFTGELLNINAFDQEGVELGKKFTFALMGRKGFEEYTDRFNDYEKKRKG